MHTKFCVQECMHRTIFCAWKSVHANIKFVKLWKNNNAQSLVSFFGSDKKIITLTGYLYFTVMKFEWNIWVMTADTWYTNKMWHTDIKSTRSNQFKMGQKAICGSILDCITGRIRRLLCIWLSHIKYIWTLFFEFTV